ncbi:MAG: hypothetical protein DHS20C18_01990 [Saprospiraceae bacterium]|nr:MAG: hypothetical protein DHS20C18_01990 [Saprospiraceae bacterium]
MDENSHNDQLGSFFRKSFDNLGDDSSPGGWDIPSDAVWAGIDQGLTKPTVLTNKWPWQKWALVACLLIGIVLIGFQINTNIQLKKQLSAQSTQIEILQGNLNQLLAEKQQEGSTHQQTVEEVEPKYPTLTQYSKSNTVTPGAIKENKTAPTATPPFSIENTTIIPKVTSDPLPSMSIGRIERDQKITTILPASDRNMEKAGIPVLYPRLTSVAPMHPRIHFVHSPLPKFVQNSAGVFFIGAYTSPNLSGNTVFKRTLTETTFKDRESAQLSGEHGLELGVQLTKHWSIRSGINFYAINLKSHQVFDVEYNPEYEMQVSDKFYSEYSLTIPSSYGSSDVEVQVKRSAGQSIQAGRSVPFEFRCKKKLNFVSVPMIAAYKIGNGRLSFNVKAGLALNLLSTKSFSIPHVKVKHHALKFHQIKIHRSFDETHNLTMDYLLGLGIAYQMSLDWSLALEPTFRKNITPIISTDIFRTNNYSIGLHVGNYFWF